MPVVVISTGGTISSRTDATGAKVATATGHDVVATATGHDVLTQAGALTSVRIVDLMIVDSSALTLGQLDLLRAAVAQALVDPDVEGVVVTHGTDTLEESAMLVDIMHRDPRPVVFTGAQHSADDPEPDGPANLREAIAVAADPRYRGSGALISFAGTVQTARGTIKSVTNLAQPFIGGLPLPDPNFAVSSAALNRITLAPTPIAGGRVEVISSYPGADGELLRVAVKFGADGVVLIGTGSANTTIEMVAAVTEATAQGVPVVVVSRVPVGPVHPRYAGGGGALDLQAAGATVAVDLRAGQARIALLALLAAGATGDEIARFFTSPVSQPDPQFQAGDQ